MLAIITAISNRFPSYIYLGKLKTNYSTLFYAERQSVLPTTIHHIPEHINAIATLFSSYKITKQPAVSGAAARNSGSNTTVLNKSKYKAGPKSMHMSRKRNAMSERRKHSTNSPQSVSNSQSPTTRNHSTSPASLRANSPVIIAPETAADPKLNMKCAVIMQENENVINYKRQQVAFINELLEKQREMQRQRALKRQEFQNILKQKREEGKRLMAEISQIKKQQAAAHEKILKTQTHQPKQSPTLLNRKRLLVRERNITFKTKTKVRSRSTTPNRTNNLENVAETAGEGIDTASAAIIQTMIGDTFELATEAMPLSDGANRTSVALKSIKATQMQDKKSTTSIRSTTGASNGEANTLTNSTKCRVPSTSSNTLTKLNAIEQVNSALQLTEENSNEKQNADTSSKAIKTNITAISTQTMKSLQEAEELTGMEIPSAVLPLTSKTSFKPENPKIPALLALATTTPYKRCARSMTPTRGDYDTTKQSELHTKRITDNLLVNCSSPLSTPTTSRTRLQRAPSLSPSIFMNRNRVEVRRSMQDPTSNTDFTTNSTSWLLNASPRTFSKTLKVRLKRLQHINMLPTTANSPEKETNDKISMPASVMPTLLSEHEARTTHTVANALNENIGIATQESQIKNNKRKRVQLLKQQLKKELHELGKSFVRPVDAKTENTLRLLSSKDIACSQATQTAEERINKGARRKHAKKVQQNSKKLKRLEKVNNDQHTNKMQTDLTINDSPSDNAVGCDSKDAKTAKSDVGDDLQCDRNQETKEIIGETLANVNNDLCPSSRQITIESSETVVEQALGQHSENNAKHQQFSIEPSNSDKNAIEDIEIATAQKEPASNNSMSINCDNVMDKKHKRTHKHGAIVTQVVDVTPGRHVNDNLLSDLLLVAAANNSAVLNSNDVLNTTASLAFIEPPAAELPIPRKITETCTKPTVEPTSVVKPNNLLPEIPNGASDKTHVEIADEMAVAVSGLAMLANRPLTTINTENCKNAPEFQNENVDTIFPKKMSSESISSDMQCVAEPTTVIGLLNDTRNHTITTIDAHATTDETKQRVVEIPNDIVALPNDKGDITDGEESSSDCLLSQLSKRVHKMSDLESIVDATTVHVIKDATMTLMSFEATPTLPAYLLNGESRDVPTPPAIATPAPTPAPTPTPTADLYAETEQPKSEPTPPLPELMIKENAHAPTPIDPIIKEHLTTPNDSTDAMVAVKVPEPAQENMSSLADAPLQAQQAIINTDEGLSNNHLSAPLTQEQQQFELEVNSPAPASAISTSDHEVSSTQEIVYTPTKRSNANTLNSTAGMSIPTPNEEEAAMLVQNSQIDTTHHLPESSYYMRKRARKFSDEFTLSENKNENSAKDIMKQRRKTFSSESCLPAQFSSNLTTFTKNNNELTNSSATAGTSNGINNGGQNSGGSSPSTTTEPVTKHAPARRRNHQQKRNNSQSPLTARSRAGGSAGELNGSFVYSCSRLQPTNVDMADVEHCVVLPASAVVPPVNLGNIARTYSKNNIAQIKVFVPPEVEMCLENADAEKDATVATTTSKRGRPKGGIINRSRKQTKDETAEKVKAKKTATNITKTKTMQSSNKRDTAADSRPKPADSKSSKSTTSTKTPTRSKHVERASNRKRK
ncbi:serine-rich adhesin for platelets-like [Bactrocera oleae]|uniref:serine-rich adhesin for platelets-like n=1 Tax=Bactrocera oleae TaxID=104688 RepID=UPI00387E4E04